MAPEGQERTRDDFEDLVRALFAVEDELGLFDLEVAGVRFWERVRPRLFLDATGTTGLLNSGRPSRLSRSQARLQFVHNVARSLLSRNPFWRSGTDIAFWGYARRKPDGTGRWMDLYCDPVIRHLLEAGLDPILFESSYFGRHFVPASTRRMRYMEPVHLLAAMTKRLGNGGSILTSQDRSLLHGIELELSKTLGVDVDLEEKVAAQVLHHRALLPWLRRLIEVVKPKLVLLAVSSGKETLVQACREAGVTTAELQHGLVGPLHLGYAFPGRGRKVMFPDYFLAFGDFWRENTPFPIPRDRVISVGYPYFEEERRRLAAIGRRNQIVFLSQATIGKDLSKLAIATAKEARIPFDVIYKLHPAEYTVWERDYPWLRDGAVTVIDHDRIPLYRLMTESSLLVGGYSTALCEGLGLGVPTCVAHVPGWQQLRSLVERGAIRLVRSVDDIRECLSAQPAASTAFCDELFRPHALNNIHSWIEARVGVSNVPERKFDAAS